MMSLQFHQQLDIVGSLEWRHNFYIPNDINLLNSNISLFFIQKQKIKIKTKRLHFTLRRSISISLKPCRNSTEANLTADSPRSRTGFGRRNLAAGTFPPLLCSSSTMPPPVTLPSSAAVALPSLSSPSSACGWSKGRPRWTKRQRRMQRGEAWKATRSGGSKIGHARP